MYVDSNCSTFYYSTVAATDQQASAIVYAGTTNHGTSAHGKRNIHERTYTCMQPKINIGNAEIPEEIKKAIEDFVAKNTVPDDAKIAVSQDEDGNIARDAEGNIVVSVLSSAPDPCELPAAYNDTTRVSEADDRYKNHLETHWGF